MQIGGRTVGPGAPALIIAEVAQAHGGSFERALAYVDAVAGTGVDAIKFQTHLAARESSLDEPFRVALGGPDRTRYDYWKRMEFTEAQWVQLAAHTRERGLMFLSSAFSVEAVELLARLGMPAWKLGSGEFRSFELLEAIRRAGGPVLLSTGMSRYAEIEAMAARLRQNDMPFALIQCTSLYPSPLEKVGLNVLDEFRQRFGVPVGLSDHSGTVYPGLAALARGAELLEVHVVLDRDQTGPDATSSLTPAELGELARARDAFARMVASPVDKDVLAGELETMRALFTKSAAPARPLVAGTVLTEELLVPRKPGTGIPYAERQKVLGRRLRRDVTPDHVLQWSDLDENKT
jgi:N-acetylneuraminate synthase